PKMFRVIAAARGEQSLRAALFFGLLFLYAEVVVTQVLRSLAVAEPFQRDFVFSSGQRASRQVHRHALGVARAPADEAAKGQYLFAAASVNLGAKARIVVPRFDLDLNMRDLRSPAEHHLFGARFGPGGTGNQD